MDTFIIIPNVNKDDNLEVTQLLIHWLEVNQYKIILPNHVAQSLNKPYGADLNSVYKEADCAIILGGDGTIIHSARELAEYSIPILGINLGHLGFLAEVEKGDAVHTLKQVVKGHYSMQKRMMLDAHLCCDESTKKIGHALNDIVITRSRSLSRILRFKIYVNHTLVNAYSADGVIISTPTGSTAYNLSAGGPLLNPKDEMIIITPICPHSLYSRSIVLSKEDIVKIVIAQDERLIDQDIMLTIDGQEGRVLKENEEVLITKSKYYTSLITTGQNNYYELLRKKLGN